MRLRKPCSEIAIRVFALFPSIFVMGSFLASSSAGGLVAAGVGAAGVALALRQFAKVPKKSCTSYAR